MNKRLAPTAGRTLRPLVDRRLSRRDALRMGGMSAAALALAACGVKGTGGEPAASSSADLLKDFWEGKTRNGKLRWANWAEYQTPDNPEWQIFEAESGIDVEYDEVINEMPPWFAKIQPALSARQDIGYDLMNSTTGVEFTLLIKSGFLAPLDHSRLPTVKENIGPSYKSSMYDPGNVYSVPHFSGITGIAYDAEKVGGEITSIHELWNPKYKGKIGMASDNQELANFGLLAIGVNPEEATKDDWLRAAGKLREQRTQELVRNYYTDDARVALGKGEVWITMAWSGELAILNYDYPDRDFRFLVPDEGATIWTDCFTIPITSQNPVDALECIDFFYRPEIMAPLTEWNWYIPALPAVQKVFEQQAAEAEDEDTRQYYQDLAKDPLIFPSAEVLSRLHYYVELDENSKKEFDAIFTPIVQGG